jgi:hypothetical protein
MFKHLNLNTYQQLKMMVYRNLDEYFISIREKKIFNIEGYLNSLPHDIAVIYLFNKGITYLPELTRFTELTELHCNFNELTCLPDLPKRLRVLECTNNKLTSLPELPNNLEILKLYKLNKFIYFNRNSLLGEDN